MDAEKIREARLAQPFGKFTLVLDDGRHLPVEQPYHLGISPKGKELTYATMKPGFEHIPVSRVVSILPGVRRNEAGQGRA